jgi:Rod binding domain-containing protein
MTVSPVTTNSLATSASEAQRENQTKLAELRHAAEQLVGITFFQTLLQSAHNSTLKGDYGHGGRGEEMFTAQLDVIFAERAAESSRFGLVDEIYARMAKRYLLNEDDAPNTLAARASVNVVG